MTTTIVVLPGADGSAALRGEFIECLMRHYPVQAVDYPPSGALDAAQIGAFVRSLLPTDGPFVILAESYSGPVAVRIAATKPAGLVGLILVASFIAPPRPWLSWAGVFTRLLPLGWAPRPLLEWVMLGHWSSVQKASALVAAEQRLDAATRGQRIGDALVGDVSVHCREVFVPTLSVVAGSDRLVPRRASELICERISRARQVVVPGPHALLLAVPSEVAEQVREFVDSLNPVPA